MNMTFKDFQFEVCLIWFLWRHVFPNFNKSYKKVLTSLVKKFPFSGLDSCDVIRFRISADNCTMILQYHWTEKIVKIGFFMKILIQRRSWASTKARGQFIKIWNLSEMAISNCMPLVWVPKPWALHSKNDSADYYLINITWVMPNMNSSTQNDQRICLYVW